MGYKKICVLQKGEFKLVNMVIEYVSRDYLEAELEPDNTHLNNVSMPSHKNYSYKMLDSSQHMFFRKYIVWKKNLFNMRRHIKIHNHINCKDKFSYKSSLTFEFLFMIKYCKWQISWLLQINCIFNWPIKLIMTNSTTKIIWLYIIQMKIKWVLELEN